MTTLTIQLPDELARFLRQCAAGGDGRSESEVVRQMLAERELESQVNPDEWESLHPALLSRLNSADYVEADDAYWEALEARLARRREKLANSPRK